MNNSVWPPWGNQSRPKSQSTRKDPETIKEMKTILKDSAVITGGIVAISLVAQKGMKMNLGVNVTVLNTVKLFASIIATSYVVRQYYDSQ